MSHERSDALVFFGITGDLAYKKIFPALHAMARRGMLDLPVVGVASSAMTREALVERARASITQYGGGVDEPAFAALAASLCYVQGNYQEPGTYQALRQALRGARAPLHYLALPPSLCWVRGTHRDPAPSRALRRPLRGARPPLHYLAIPPSLFGTVVEGLAGARRPGRGRRRLAEAVGRGRASAP